MYVSTVGDPICTPQFKLWTLGVKNRTPQSRVEVPKYCVFDDARPFPPVVPPFLFPLYVHLRI